jgi:hypothetical protein
MPNVRVPYQRSRQWNEEQAREVLEEWKRSGETLAVFSRKRGLVPERLYIWRKRFAAERSAPTRALSLVPATVVSTDPDVIVRLRDGVVIEIADASPRWVAAMVTELTRSS